MGGVRSCKGCNLLKIAETNNPPYHICWCRIKFQWNGDIHCDIHVDVVKTTINIARHEAHGQKSLNNATVSVVSQEKKSLSRSY